MLFKTPPSRPPTHPSKKITSLLTHPIPDGGFVVTINAHSSFFCIISSSLSHKLGSSLKKERLKFTQFRITGNNQYNPPLPTAPSSVYHLKSRHSDFIFIYGVLLSMTSCYDFLGKTFLLTKGFFGKCLMIQFPLITDPRSILEIVSSPLCCGALSHGLHPSEINMCKFSVLTA